MRALGETAFGEDGQTDQLPELAADERADGPEGIGEVGGVEKLRGLELS